MQHIAQQPDECYLVATAILRNVPIATLRQEAAKMLRDLTGKPKITYAWIFRKVGHDERQYRAIIWYQFATLFGKKYAMPHGVALIAPPPTGCPPAPPEQFLGRVGELAGRGTIDILFAKRQMRHIVVYQDGIIYDGLAEGPLAYSDWLYFLKGQGKALDHLVIREDLTVPPTPAIVKTEEK